MPALVARENTNARVAKKYCSDGSLIFHGVALLKAIRMLLPEPYYRPLDVQGSLSRSSLSMPFEKQDLITLKPARSTLVILLRQGLALYTRLRIIKSINIRIHYLRSYHLPTHSPRPFVDPPAARM